MKDNYMGCPVKTKRTKGPLDEWVGSQNGPGATTGSPVETRKGTDKKTQETSPVPWVVFGDKK